MIYNILIAFCLKVGCLIERLLITNKLTALPHIFKVVDYF